MLKRTFAIHHVYFLDRVSSQLSNASLANVQRSNGRPLYQKTNACNALKYSRKFILFEVRKYTILQFVDNLCYCLTFQPELYSRKCQKRPMHTWFVVYFNHPFSAGRVIYHQQDRVQYVLRHLSVPR